MIPTGPFFTSFLYSPTVSKKKVLFLAITTELYPEAETQRCSFLPLEFFVLFLIFFIILNSDLMMMNTLFFQNQAVITHSISAILVIFGFQSFRESFPDYSPSNTSSD